MLNEPHLVFLGILSLGALLWTFANGILIGRYLEKRGVQVKWWMFRFLIFKYVNQYKELTQKEQGRVGPLYPRIALSFRVFLIILSITIVALILSRM